MAKEKFTQELIHRLKEECAQDRSQSEYWEEHYCVLKAERDKFDIDNKKLALPVSVGALQQESLEFQATSTELREQMSELSAEISEFRAQLRR